MRPTRWPRPPLFSVQPCLKGRWGGIDKKIKNWRVNQCRSLLSGRTWVKLNQVFNARWSEQNIMIDSSQSGQVNGRERYCSSVNTATWSRRSYTDFYGFIFVPLFTAFISAQTEVCLSAQCFQSPGCECPRFLFFLTDDRGRVNWPSRPKLGT